MYEIRNINDILTGATLVVSIPEDDLDHKALQTILEDQPEFILPFHHKIVDGIVEFTFQIGKESKLYHIAGERLPIEYIELWCNIMRPLSDCGDWFLKPFSFVLDIKYLYCDKSKNKISYVYIPSLSDYSDDSSLKEMAAKVSGQISVADNELENKVLKAIMTGLDPKSFLQMLKTSSTILIERTYLPIANVTSYGLTNVQNEIQDFENLHHRQEEKIIGAYINTVEERDEQDDFDDIVIDIPQESKKAARHKKTKAIKEPRREKMKQDTKKTNRQGLFRKRSDEMEDDTLENNGLIPSSGMTTVSASTQRHQRNEVYQPVAQQYISYNNATSDKTQFLFYDSGNAWLRLVGISSLPTVIGVPIENGEIFTIGRCDIDRGKAMSSFEFDRMTKAVSRRHAAIERDDDGYCIIDLSSSAGTYIDGMKLLPNTPSKLQLGSRISFGNCGADYIWEQ
ncbi:MAG: FHA domain-containing protein [Oscillospiraceae bacterium]|nr:FHA domain-containing protein [Oscillospiraceae bacterium]